MVQKIRCDKSRSYKKWWIFATWTWKEVVVSVVVRVVVVGWGYPFLGLSFPMIV